MKKALSILLAMGMTVGMVAGCGDTADNSSAAASTEAGTDGTQAAASAADIKVGVIYIGDENEGYTAAHMAGIDEMAANLGLSDDQIIEKTTIPEDEKAYDAAVDLAEQGCTPFEERIGECTWEVALVIPYAVFFKHRITSLDGQTIKANFYKCGDELQTPHFLSWNPINIEKPDFHRPDFFGSLEFE